MYGYPMKTGVIVLGMHSCIPAEVSFAEQCAEYLRSRGRKNVRVAYHDRDSCEVLESMFVSDGIDTFCILPITVAEGNQTVWNMPRRIGLPDNAGSWRMVGEHDIATRFSTALGRDPRMAEAILEMLGSPSDDSGILLLAHGSELSMSAKTAEYYAEALRLNGWKAECGFARFGRSSAEAAQSLRGQGCVRIRILPLSITVDGGYMQKAIESAGAAELLEPVSRLPVFLEILASKVPEDW